MDVLGEKLKFSSFETEEDFIRMMLLLLNELKKLHKENIVHRDIKLENIMFYEVEEKIFFCFIDFGSAHYIKGEREKILTRSDKYSAPELNTDLENFKCKIS